MEEDDRKNLHEILKNVKYEELEGVDLSITDNTSMEFIFESGKIFKSAEQALYEGEETMVGFLITPKFKALLERVGLESDDNPLWAFNGVENLRVIRKYFLNFSLNRLVMYPDLGLMVQTIEEEIEKCHKDGRATFNHEELQVIEETFNMILGYTTGFDFLDYPDENLN